MRRCVEIRSYNLKPGTRSDFHQRMLAEAVPMQKRWSVDVVTFGPLPHDADSYYLDSFLREPERPPEERQDAFYGGSEWKEGPRNGILGLIESYTSIVLELDNSTVDPLRKIKGSFRDSAFSTNIEWFDHPNTSNRVSEIVFPLPITLWG